MHTSKVEEAEVVNNNAYILFYQKQIKGGSQSSSQEHWVYRMPDFHYKHKLTKAQQQQQNLKAATSGSSTTTTVANKASPQNKAETKSPVQQVKSETTEEKSKPEVKTEESKKEEDVEEEEVA